MVEPNPAPGDTPADSATVADTAPTLQRADSSQFFFHHTFTRANPGRLEDFYQMDSDQLGEGSFGSVYKVKCQKTGAERAVKTMEAKALKNVQKFEREINIAKQLDHPNVVRLYETFKDNQKIYLVMELCTGGELFDTIIEQGDAGFDECKAAMYTKQILSAICYLHAQNFCHRDVKPENFLFNHKGPDASLKMVDFGLACTFEKGKPMKTKAGTAYYVAPDVLSGAYDEKCDVWSAGVICFVLVCGYPPFSGEADQQILKRVKRGFFEFKSPEWDDVSHTAKNLITQMLTFDPALRPSAEVLLLSPWLKYKASEEAAPVSKDFIKRLRNFNATSKLRKIALTAVVQQLGDEKIEELQKTFRSLDKNGDGMLSAAEIRTGLAAQGMKVPVAFEDLLKNIDSDGSGQLDYTEFLAATVDQKHLQQREVCWGAFRSFDLDGDGKITRDELMKVLNGNRVQQALGASKIDKMIQDVDANGDGAIDFDEFCAMLAPPAKRRRIGEKSIG